MKCKYRNCDKEITGGTKAKEFCNVSCRSMEGTYRQRAKAQLDKKIKFNMGIIEEVMFFKQMKD